MLIYAAVINIITFAVCGADKAKARKNLWRVRESTLFLLSAIGGSVGMLIGMRAFRHKTKHKAFTVGIPLILALQLAGIAYFVIK